MKETNLTRMMKVIEGVFAMRKDPLQLQVNEKVLAKLEQIHPATLSEYNEGNGPAVWVLVIPTTTELMNRFLEEKISEQELFDQTNPGRKYETIYLCSATTLHEYRGKGITKRLCCEAIERIRSEHKIKKLFVWTFTPEGDELAESIARETKLPLLKRKMIRNKS